MPDPVSRILPEGLAVSSVVEDEEFTEVTADGEVYTRYRIVRFTHELADHPDGWTHLANVARVSDNALGVAHLLVKDRVIEESFVKLSPVQE